MQKKRNISIYTFYADFSCTNKAKAEDSEKKKENSRAQWKYEQNLA